MGLCSYTFYIDPSPLLKNVVAPRNPARCSGHRPYLDGHVQTHEGRTQPELSHKGKQEARGCRAEVEGLGLLLSSLNHATACFQELCSALCAHHVVP